MEAIVIVPVTSILALFCLERRSWSFYYAAIATVGSLIGGLIAYAIGYFVWDLVGQKIVTLFFSPQQFDHAVSFYKEHESLTVLVAGFTPVPYKLITLSAGFCKLPLLPFIVCSFISRGLRFFIVAGLVYYGGESFKKYFDRYSIIFLPIAVVVVAYGLWSLTKH